MRYLYINQKEDRVVLMSKKQESHVISDDCVEYIINDDFDLTKEMSDGEGNLSKLEGFLTATEFLARYNNNYVAKRVSAYPSIEDQLDKIYHEGIDAWKSEIKAIKDANPKK
tara:strand:- start:43 stop:378 length:336 start_codon:yes stop_codon:yes gene_type:complete